MQRKAPEGHGEGSSRSLVLGTNSKRSPTETQGRVREDSLARSSGLRFMGLRQPWFASHPRMIINNVAFYSTRIAVWRVAYMVALLVLEGP